MSRRCIRTFFALAIDLVVAPWGEKIEAVERYPLHESIAAAGQDDHAVIRVRADRVKQVNELLVGMAVEDERAAVGVQRHFQNASRRTAETGIGETIAISVKAAHGILRAIGEADSTWASAHSGDGDAAWGSRCDGLTIMPARNKR
jgi:hypothetical protein